MTTALYSDIGKIELAIGRTKEYPKANALTANYWLQKAGTRKCPAKHLAFMTVHNNKKTNNMLPTMHCRYGG